MLKIVILKDSLNNSFIARIDSTDRAADLFKNQNSQIVASFDVSDLYMHATNL